MTTEIKNTKQIGDFNVLPPAPDRCQVCAVQHEPHEPHNPHNPQSFYYRTTFAAENGRAPTWVDAMATRELVLKTRMR